jgi:hypothetical protein
MAQRGGVERCQRRLVLVQQIGVEPAAFEELAEAGDDPPQDALQFLLPRWADGMKPERPVGVGLVDAVQDQGVEVDVQTGTRIRPFVRG